MSSAVSLEYLNSVLPAPSSVASTRFNNAGTTYAVILGGTPISFPSATYNNGVTANGANTVFTVANAGSYQISYRISTTASLGVGMVSSCLINGTAAPVLTRSPGLATNDFSASGIVTLAAGSTISVQLSGLLATAVLQGGCGAVLNIVKIA